LVITFRVVVLDKLADGVAQMTLAERNDVPEAVRSFPAKLARRREE
jgi:hypothetical protein